MLHNYYYPSLLTCRLYIECCCSLSECTASTYTIGTQCMQRKLYMDVAVALCTHCRSDTDACISLAENTENCQLFIYKGTCFNPIVVLFWQQMRLYYVCSAVNCGNRWTEWESDMMAHYGAILNFPWSVYIGKQKQWIEDASMEVKLPVNISTVDHPWDSFISQLSRWIIKKPPGKQHGLAKTFES